MGSLAKRIILLLTVACVFGTLAVYFYGRSQVLTQEREAERRVKARERWLVLYAKSPKEALKGMDNARLFMSCFKEGEAAADYERILATTRRKYQYPTLERPVE